MLFAGDDVGPERLDVGGLQQAAPGRHAVLAIGHRVDEAVVLVGREGAEVERSVRVVHVGAVARRTVAGVEIGAVSDLFLVNFGGFFADCAERLQRRVPGRR